MGKERRERDEFAVLLEKVPEDTAKELCAELDKLIPEYALRADAINAADGGDKPYHKGPHSREMSADAARIRKNASHFFADDESAALELYVKLVQAIHAAHDIVQGKGSGENERLSAEDFIKQFHVILERINYKGSVRKSLQTAVNEFARRLIIDGTVMNFTTYKQPFIQKCLDGDLPDSPLLALGCLHIAMNDTTRMLSLPDMFSDPIALRALRSQYRALKNNMLIRTLRSTVFRKGADLYTHVKSNLRKGVDLYTPVKNKLKKAMNSLRAMSKDPEFDNLPPDQLMATLSFMHLFGQNLRINSEFDNKSIGAALFRRHMDVGVSEFDTETANATYDFIMQKMDADLGEGGFCQGMRWTEAGVPRINSNFREKYGIDFDVLDNTYPTLWADYILNARLVLSDIRARVSILSGTEQDKFKRQFVEQSLAIARNQTGLFMMKDDQQRRHYSYSAL